MRCKKARLSCKACSARLRSRMSVTRQKLSVSLTSTAPINTGMQYPSRWM